MHELHPDLQRTVRANRMILGVFLLAAVVPIVLAFVLRVPTPPVFGVPVLKLVLFTDAVLTAIVAWVVAGVVPAWYRRATRVYHSGVPRRMKMTLRYTSDGEGGSVLSADLSPLGAEPGKAVRYALLPPKFSIAPLHDATEVDVLAESTPGGPIVIRTPQGVLWSSAAFTNRWRRLP